MKNILVLLCVIGVFDFASAQDKQSLAGGLGLFVFPAKGQDKETQSLEEYECYLWAKDQTGINPLNPLKFKQLKLTDQRMVLLW
jgi:hypothetical protein